MRLFRIGQIVLAVFLVHGFLNAGSAQTQAPTPPAAPAPAAASQPKCGPDHAILYKRAVTLLDKAEKKLNTGYTAEAKSAAKEAKSLFAILQRECGQEQKERVLTPKEEQQEAINQKLSADEQAQAERLEKSADAKFKKAQPLEAGQPDMYQKLMREAKGEYEQAQKRSIRAMIYAIRTQQMLFQFLVR
jgi:hypothetical protein